MGLCKCIKISDLYCFNHKRAVCNNCIATDHKTCTVGTYVEWLQNPDFTASVCEMCKGELTPAHVIRLMCLHMLHPECLDMHAAGFPPNTAKAGYICPVPGCKTPLVPTNPHSSTLAEILYNHIEHSSWFDTKSQPMTNESSEHSKSSYLNNDDSFDRNYDIESRGTKQRIPSETLLKDSANVLIDHESNKRANPIFDDDADKYHKNQLLKLIHNPAPIIGSSTDSHPRRSRGSSTFTTKRILIMFALLSTLLIVALLSTSLE